MEQKNELLEKNSNISDKEFSYSVTKAVFESIYAQQFKSRLIGELQSRRSIKLQSRFLSNVSEFNVNVDNVDAWRSVSYWNWLRPHMMHVSIVSESEYPSNDNPYLESWIEPVTVSILGENVGSDLIMPESLMALSVSIAILICSLCTICFLRRYKRKIIPTRHKIDLLLQ